MEQLMGLSVPLEETGEDGIPFYRQLSKTIQDHIENGRLAVGEQLPTERSLASLNKISMATVRKALENLVQQGLITRAQGKGTFVSSSAIRRKKIRYYPLVEDFHGETANTQVKFLALNVIKGDSKICNSLKIRPTQEVYEMRRIFMITGHPVIYCISYLPRDMFKNLKDYKKIDFEEGYLYLFLEREFGIPTTENVELYGVAVADKETAKALKVKIGRPLLKVEMISLTHKKIPYEYRVSYCLTDERKIRRAY